jgi:hypothetical protein
MPQTQAGPFQSDLHFAQRPLTECDPELFIQILRTAEQSFQGHQCDDKW